MKTISIIKTGLISTLICNTALVSAITFTTSKLKDTSSSNYIGFNRDNDSYNDKYEKIIADFNSDGIDDILSLGGPINCSLCSPQPPPFPAQMLLKQGNDYFSHEINIGYNGSRVEVVDIDKDGDNDMVFSNGKIAINDGQANFTLIAFSNGQLSNAFYAVDWDNDDAIDIVSNSNIFINDGDLNFTRIDNSVANGNNMLLVELDANSGSDMLVINGNQLESWLQDSAGGFSLNSTFELEISLNSIHAIDVNADGAMDFIVTKNDESQPVIQLLLNDGQGKLSLSDFEFSHFNDVPYDTLQVTKVFVKDADNDGDDELWINATFVSSALQCENKQNLLLIYENIDNGLLQFKRSLHSTGYRGGDSSFGEVETESFPTLIDLNDDNMLDVVMPGDKPATWMQGSQFHFRLSSISTLQYNKHIDVADFDADGNIDIFSSAQYSGECNALDYSEKLNSVSRYSIGSQLWLSDGQGGFEAYSSSIGGGNDFLGSHEYTKFADLENSGSPSIIYTATQENGVRFTQYKHPMVADPPFNIAFPEVTINVKVANLDNLGEKEIVMIADTEDAPIMVLGYQYPQFKVLQELKFGARNGEIALADMDNDGNIDIVASTYGTEDSIKIWYNDGHSNFMESEPFSDFSYGMAIIDINNDGRKDVFISNRDIWINQGNRNFDKIRYDNNFWSTPYGLPFYQYLVPKKMEVVDINQDGKDDIVFNNWNDYYVFVNDSINNNISFYLAYSTSFISASQNNRHNMVLGDINNDNQLDFIVGTENNISIYTQNQETPMTGLYFDSEYNGHGHSINAIGYKNLYYSVFFSYDDQGKPEWYSTLNRYAEFNNSYNPKYYFSSLNQNEFIHYLYDYSSNSAQIDENIQKSGYLVFSGGTQNNFLDTFSYKIGDEFNTWNIQPIILESKRPENDFSGLWWAGTEDAGWGISLSFIQRENTQEVVAVLYFYDEFGEPRWLIGQSTGFELNQEFTLNMKQINGYGRLQNHVELTEVAAGTITLNLQQASKNSDQAGTMSMDVFYPSDQENDNWLRNNIPIALFSKPRN